MASFVRKLLYIALNIFLALSAIFFVLRLTPGDPIERILGEDASQEELQVYREELGLHKPIHLQYIDYLKGFASLDMGKSFYQKESVVTLIKKHMSPSIIIAFSSLSISLVLGVFLGVLSAVYKSQKADSFIRIFTLLSLSFPIFSLAPVLTLIFAIKLQWLPVSEWGELKHLVLPVMTLVFPLSSILARVTRNKFLEEKSFPWVDVLKAKGLSHIPIVLRVVKVCLPTVLNVLAIQLSIVLAGTIITETIFDIPGMGSLLFESIQNRDYPLVQAAVAYSTLIYMAVYFLIDIVNAKIDPRIGART